MILLSPSPGAIYARSGSEVIVDGVTSFSSNFAIFGGVEVILPVRDMVVPLRNHGFSLRQMMVCPSVDSTAVRQGERKGNSVLKLGTVVLRHQVADFSIAHLNAATYLV